MFCDQCGTTLTPQSKFCPNCGKQLTLAVAARGDQRVSRHIQLLAILWIARGAIRLLEVVGIYFAGRVLVPNILDFNPLSGLFSHVLAWMLPVLGFFGLVSILVGVGLLERAPWGRTVALVMGFLVLLTPVLGTALGVYTLWVLLPQRSDEEYQSLSMAA